MDKWSRPVFEDSKQFAGYRANPLIFGLQSAKP
jgi:hypothetical protein